VGLVDLAFFVGVEIALRVRATLGEELGDRGPRCLANQPLERKGRREGDPS